MKILVSGALGFLGHHLMPRLIRKYGKESIIGVSKKDFDLTDPMQFERMMKKYKPNTFYHLAAYSGGIGANKTYPADFYHINSLLTTYAFHYSSKYNVSKIVYPMGGCSYPATAKSPIDEKQMWMGFPQKESAAYSSAKKSSLVASEAYKKQYDLDSVILIPGNMYGENDNFSKENSHVIPGMVRRFYEAQLMNAQHIEMWGTGSPTRDFVYAGDVADCMIGLAELPYDNQIWPVNISTGTKTSISDLAVLVSNALGFEGEISWNSKMPDGQMEKIFSVEKLNSLGYNCCTSLEDGIKKTISWFKSEYENQSPNLRLK